jgi:hypothetical protein
MFLTQNAFTVDFSAGVFISRVKVNGTQGTTVTSVKSTGNGMNLNKILSVLSKTKITRILFYQMNIVFFFIINEDVMSVIFNFYYK